MGSFDLLFNDFPINDGNLPLSSSRASIPWDASSDTVESLIEATFANDLVNVSRECSLLSLIRVGGGLSNWLESHWLLVDGYFCDPENRFAYTHDRSSQSWWPQRHQYCGQFLIQWLHLFSLLRADSFLDD